MVWVPKLSASWAYCDQPAALVRWHLILLDRVLSTPPTTIAGVAVQSATHVVVDHFLFHCVFESPPRLWKTHGTRDLVRRWLGNSEMQAGSPR
jgi:hypothetical protein